MSEIPADRPSAAKPAAGPQDDAASTAKRLGSAVGRAAGTAAHGTRETIRRHPTANTAYRIGVGVVGGGTFALGVVLMPLPGPGTLVALGGLGILSTEFESARKVTSTARTVARKAAGVVRDARR
jgi:hypothetical protein